ncbi:MAG: hypothetical protein CMH12_18410 [Maritimibacter sp.]|nr:hypothetical protein [Maritimibacter sp.]
MVTSPAPQTDQIINVSDFGAVGDGSYHSVREWLVGGALDMAYENLRAIQQDYPCVTSLDDSIDRIAIQTAFDALHDGGHIQFEAGANYIFDAPVLVKGKSLSADMTGATVTMAADSSYNAFRIAGTDAEKLEFVTWTGGTIDGNNDEIDWPGSDRPDTEFIVIGDETDRDLRDTPDIWRYEGDVVDHNTALWNSYQVFGNNGLLGIHNAETAFVDGVTLIDTVSDGIVLSNVVDGTIANSLAYGGAPLEFLETLELYGRGTQSTYFKGRQVETDTFDGGTFTVIGSHTKGGSIGIAMSTPGQQDVLPNSKIVVEDSSVTNALMEGIHIEHSTFVEIYGTDLIRTDLEFRTNIHIGNGTEYAILEDVQAIGTYITFREASNLVEGKVINTSVINDDPNIANAIQNATHVIGSYVETAGEAAILADNVIDTTIARFTTTGIRKAYVVEGVTIDNALGGGGGIGMANYTGGEIVNSTFSNLERGFLLVSGSVKVTDSVFENIQTNAIQHTDVGTIEIYGSTFINYGTEAVEELKSHAVTGLRTYHTAETIIIDDSTQFISDVENAAFRETDEIQIVEAVEVAAEDSGFTGSTADAIAASENENRIDGSTGDDAIQGRDGDDHIYGDDGNDHIRGGAQHDLLDGGRGNDLLAGENGRDTLIGGDGDDTLEGGAHNDEIYDGDGNDRIHTGSGADTVYLGAGADTLVFKAADVGQTDRIFGFNAAEGDGLDLTGLFGTPPGVPFDLGSHVTIVDKGDGVFVLFADRDGGSVPEDPVKLAAFYDTLGRLSLELLVINEQVDF